MNFQGNFIFSSIEIINLDTFKIFFKEFDKTKSGKIIVDDFLEYLSEKYNFNTNFNPFYYLIVEQLIGKSEKIIHKLKNIKQKVYNDTEIIGDIDWYNSNNIG